jgi:hypothetical protein
MKETTWTIIDAGRRIILKVRFLNWDGRTWIDISWLRIRKCGRLL